MFIADIEPDFKDKLKELVPNLLQGENLIVKEINGCQVTCRDLLEYFKVIYMGYGKCSKFFNTFLFLFSNRMLVINA